MVVSLHVNTFFVEEKWSLVQKTGESFERRGCCNGLDASFSFLIRSFIALNEHWIWLELVIHNFYTLIFY